MKVLSLTIYLMALGATFYAMSYLLEKIKQEVEEAWKG